MKLKPKRRTHRAGWFRLNRVGLRPTSITVDLGLWSGVLWEAKRRQGGTR